MSKLLAIGLMSGTSLDGIDACLGEIEEKENGKAIFKILKFVTMPYDKEVKQLLAKNLNLNTASLNEISGLNFEIGNLSVKAIDLLLKDTDYNYKDISFVASHGQTIWHDPDCKFYKVPSTLQIGEASIISEKTGIKVISNFRSKDIAAGGCGAPLVPFALDYLYRTKKENICFHNIGGIANLAYLPKDDSDIIAFDTGPGNCLIDYYMNLYYGQSYDDGGSVALKGMVIKPIIDYLLNDDYYKLIPPKSTGKEKYSRAFCEQIRKDLNFDDYAKEDIVSTITELTVKTMISSYKYVGKIDKLIVTGGGAHNNYIMRRLAEELDFPVLKGSDANIDEDSLEALSFIVLGYHTLKQLTSNVPSVTGAKKKVVLGSITY